MSGNSESAYGGEAALWCEGIDISTIEYRLWPRACAIGAMLWGDKRVY